jgi:hypothetical protein
MNASIAATNLKEIAEKYLQADDEYLDWSENENDNAPPKFGLKMGDVVVPAGTNARDPPIKGDGTPQKPGETFKYDKTWLDPLKKAMEDMQKHPPYRYINEVAGNAGKKPETYFRINDSLQREAELNLQKFTRTEGIRSATVNIPELEKLLKSGDENFKVKTERLAENKDEIEFMVNALNYSLLYNDSDENKSKDQITLGTNPNSLAEKRARLNTLLTRDGILEAINLNEYKMVEDLFLLEAFTLQKEELGKIPMMQKYIQFFESFIKNSGLQQKNIKILEPVNAEVQKIFNIEQYVPQGILTQRQIILITFALFFVDVDRDSVKRELRRVTNFPDAEQEQRLNAMMKPWWFQGIFKISNLSILDLVKFVQIYNAWQENSAQPIFDASLIEKINQLPNHLVRNTSSIQTSFYDRLVSLNATNQSTQYQFLFIDDATLNDAIASLQRGQIYKIWWYYIKFFWFVKYTKLLDEIASISSNQDELRKRLEKLSSGNIEALQSQPLPYEHTLEWAMNPINSGFIILDPIFTSAQSKAWDLVMSSCQEFVPDEVLNGDFATQNDFLDALTNSDEMYRIFAQLHANQILNTEQMHPKRYYTKEQVYDTKRQRNRIINDIRTRWRAKRNGSRWAFTFVAEDKQKRKMRKINFDE